MLRVRELLKRELSDVIQRDFEFPNALVTVNEVDVTPDLKQAHAYLGIIAKDDAAHAQILGQLNARRGAVQKKISSRVVLRYTPQIHFKDDRSVERGVKLVDLMQEIEQSMGEAGEGGCAEAPGTGEDSRPGD